MAEFIEFRSARFDSSPVNSAADPTTQPPIPAVPIPVPEAMAAAALLESLGRRAEAARIADRILAVFPRHPRALHLKGVCAASESRHAEAARLIEAAIAQGLEEPQMYRNLCAVLERLGRLDEAVAAGRRAVALDPTDAESYHNLTIALARKLALDDAIAAARAALALEPQRAGAHMALAEALLLRGEFAEGWAEYEWRFRLPHAAPPLPRTDRPQWDGGPMPTGKRLLLVADQGFGDVIQFARYIPWARARCADAVLAVSPEIRPLLAQAAAGLLTFASWSDCPPYDAYITLSGLPRAHATTIDTIPAPIPYIAVDSARRTAWRARLDQLTPRGYRRIGLVWAGRPEHPNDNNRSVRLERLVPLFELPGTAFVALQKGPALAEAGRVRGRAPIANLSASVANFADTAAILAELDLLVTVDTSVAHLAGALGRPVWIMLPHAPDWRWLLHREDSPWYPTVRLFRQRRSDDWDELARRVAAALNSFWPDGRE